MKVSFSDRLFVLALGFNFLIGSSIYGADIVESDRIPSTWPPGTYLSTLSSVNFRPDQDIEFIQKGRQLNQDEVLDYQHSFCNVQVRYRSNGDRDLVPRSMWIELNALWFTGAADVKHIHFKVLEDTAVTEIDVIGLPDFKLKTLRLALTECNMVLTLPGSIKF